MSKHQEAPQPKRLSKRAKALGGVAGVAATGLAAASLMPGLHTKRRTNDCAPGASVKATDIVKVKPPFYDTAVNTAGKIVVIKAEPKEEYIRVEGTPLHFLNSERGPSGRFEWFNDTAENKPVLIRSEEVCIEAPEDAGNPFRQLPGKDTPTLPAEHTRIIHVTIPEPRN